MSNQSHSNKIQDALAQAVEAHCLPTDAQDRAEKLLARLREPVRLALMGMPGAGKSKLLNLLVGDDIVADGVRLPTLQLVHGNEPQATCTLPDGSQQTVMHADGTEIAKLDPMFVEMALPLPALGKISVLEIVAPKDRTALLRASKWGAKRCDVALWCTEQFDQTEQEIWAQMPDLIKDHAFLIVTKADELRAAQTLDATLDAARHIAADEFNKILAIATTDALAARNADGTVNKDQMRSSGGLALISAVLKHVELGRQSTVDMAEILLLQHEDLLKTNAQAPAPEEKTESVAPDTAASQQSPAPTPKPIVAQNETQPAVEAPAEHPAPPAQNDTVITLHPETRDAYEHVLAYIIDQSRDMISLVERSGETSPSEIMSKTVEHMQWLSDYLNENGDDSDQALIRARDTAMDAADLVQLMQMEKRDSAAIEALSLLIQIKHELQSDLAA